MSRLRFQPVEWTTHFVTQRNLMGYLLMRPTHRTNLITAGCLAYSLERFEGLIELHAYVFLSNHYHLILSAKSQRDLSAFMSHFNGCLGKELGVIHDLHGKLWHKRYRSSPVLDEGALEDRYRYLLAHSVKEDLVKHPGVWPGLHAYKQVCMGEVVEGIWVDRTSLYHARQRVKPGEPKPQESDFTRVLTLTLAGSPPMWAELSDEEYRARCEQLTQEVVVEHQKRREAEGRGVLGVKRVLTQPIFERRFTKRTPCPLCHTRVLELMRGFKAAYWAFVAQFKEASHELRTALACGNVAPAVSFPEGGVPLFGGG